MKTKNRSIEKEAVEVTVLVLLLVIFLLTGIGVGSCFAQSFKSKSYKGFEGNFGVRSFGVKSNISELSNLNVVLEGGNTGFVFGNEILLTKVRALGFYYDSENLGRTINLFEMEGLINFYPLQLGKWSNEMVFNPYVLGGLTHDRLKFFGHYLDESGGKVNYSSSNEPYLGKIALSTATVGFGLNCKLKKEDYVERSFIHLYGEVKYGIPLSTRTDKAAFSGTSIQNYMSVNIGLVFGTYR